MLAMNLGATLTELGHYQEAGERLEEGLALLSAQFPDEDPRVRSARGYLETLAQRRDRTLD